MNTLGRALLVTGLAGAAAIACSSDSEKLGPLSPYLIADHSVVTVGTGDSVRVAVTLRDGNGRLMPVTGVWWTAQDPTVASVVLDTQPVPGSYEARAVIVGRTPTGGWTSVTIEAAGRVDTIAVAVLPARFQASLVSYAGMTHPDTIVRPALLGPPYVPPDTTVFTAPDTLVLSGTAALRFDTLPLYPGLGVVVQTSTGRLARGYLVSSSPAQLKAVFTSPAAGRLVVTGLRIVSGDTTQRSLRIDSLFGDSVAVSRQRFGGAVAVIGDTLTVAAPPGAVFLTTQNWPYCCGTTVKLDTTVLPLVAQSPSQLRALSPVAYTGSVTVTALSVTRRDGITFMVDSLKTNRSYTIGAATFPGTFTGGGRLLDTVTVHAAGGATIPYVTVAVTPPYACGGCRYAGWVVGRWADSIRFISPVAVDGPVYLSAVQVGSATFPMVTRDTLVVSGTVTGEPNEPGNDSAGGATLLVDRGSAANAFGALNSSTDTSDYYTLTFTTPKRVAATLSWIGSGIGDAINPNFDLIMCDSLAAGGCGAGNDLFQGSASTKAQSQQGTVARVPAGQVWFRVVARSPFANNVGYLLSVTYSTVP